MANLTITPETLRKLLRYEPETGKLFWRDRTPDMFVCKSHTPEHSCSKWNSRHSGKEAFTADDGNGYRQGRVFGKAMRAHRVIWAIYYGSWPDNQIDHISGDRADNKILNLRDVTNLENGKNSKMPSDNTSGVVGVSWIKANQKWQAYIKGEKKSMHLGYFDKKQDAISARLSAQAKLGYHKNHGRAVIEASHG